jgi:hypothetical protein
MPGYGVKHKPTTLLGVQYMSESEAEQTPKQPPIPSTPDTAKKVVPFRIMRRGDDTVDRDNEVVFADFSPVVLPSDLVTEEPTVPKDVYAPEPAPSTDLAPASGPSSSGTSAPPSAILADGSPNPSATSSPPSSSGKKTG